MKTTSKFVAAVLAAGLLASCSTAPNRVAVAPPLWPAARELPYQWTQGAAPQAHKDALATFGRVALKPGQYLWVAEIPEDGEARVVIDRLTQLLYVYRGDKLVGVTSVSSGKKGKETPLGLWKVFRKQVKGFSRKYDNAPMPYMQMYDEKGIAFHAGQNPGYPASHGCVRLPLKFAQKLYGLTRIGTEVIIEG